ncbi:MAG: DUF3795 domain-containing protein [Anaerolineales bacterium]
MDSPQEPSPLLEALENVKDQVGVCGIWCGSCVVGNGTLRELSRKYSAILRDYGLSEWGPKDFDYGELSKGLASLQRIPICRGCRQGGGREACEIRACATSRFVESCSECSAASDCPHAALLERMRSGARQAALFVESGLYDPQELLTQWRARLERSWPSCTLFFD